MDDFINILSFLALFLGISIAYIAHKKNWNLPEIF